MATLIEAGTGQEAYLKLLGSLVSNGARVTPRGLPCRELPDVMTVIHDATQAVPFGTGRKISLRIGATEYAQFLGGVSSLEQLDLASGRRFTQFADYGRLHGAYGPRIYRQLPWIVAKLEQDPDSRQAVTGIWKGAWYEIGAPWHDVPCTLSLQCTLRGGKVHLTAVMRSSDAWLGLPYDWWVFSRFQMTVAWALGAETGSMTFMAGSQHLYEPDAVAATAVASGKLMQTVTEAQPPAITGDDRAALDAAGRMHAAQAVAECIVLGEDPELEAGLEPATNARLLSRLVPSLPDKFWLCLTCRYVVPPPRRKGGRCQDCIRALASKR